MEEAGRNRGEKTAVEKEATTRARRKTAVEKRSNNESEEPAERTTQAAKSWNEREERKLEQGSGKEEREKQTRKKKGKGRERAEMRLASVQQRLGCLISIAHAAIFSPLRPLSSLPRFSLSLLLPAAHKRHVKCWRAARRRTRRLAPCRRRKRGHYPAALLRLGCDQDKNKKRER